MEDIFTRTRQEELINMKKYSWQTSIIEIKASIEHQSEASKQFNQSIDDNWNLREKNLVSSLNDIDHKAEIQKLEWRKTVSALERDCETLGQKRKDLANRIEAMKRSEGIYRDGNYLGPNDKLKALKCATTISAAFRGNKTRKEVQRKRLVTLAADSYPAVYDDLDCIQKTDDINSAYLPDDMTGSCIDDIDMHGTDIITTHTSTFNAGYGSTGTVVTGEGGVMVKQDGSNADEGHLDASSGNDSATINNKTNDGVESYYDDIKTNYDIDEGYIETQHPRTEQQEAVYDLVPPPLASTIPPTDLPAYTEPKMPETCTDEAEKKETESLEAPHAQNFSNSMSTHAHDAGFEAGIEPDKLNELVTDPQHDDGADTATTNDDEVGTPAIYQNEAEFHDEAPDSRPSEAQSTIGDLPNFQSNREETRTSEAESDYRMSRAESDYIISEDWNPPPPSQSQAQGNSSPDNPEGYTMSGWLLKKPTSASSTFIKRKWKKRFIKLLPSNDTVPCPNLFYFKGENDKEPLGAKVILDCTIQRITSAKYKDKFPFDLHHANDPKFSLMANTEEERESWIKAIQDANKHYYAVLEHEEKHKPEAAARRRRSSLEMSAAASSIGDID